jgi:hypothetical protein
LILVVGVGRSGTSLLTGILGRLGVRIPQPEIQANETNPRGFGEPRWVVEFHRQLMRELRITVNDARPSAWQQAAAMDHSDDLRGWLAGQLRAGDTVVIKDPRTAWFLPLWDRTVAELGIQPRYVTMLRHPAEIVRSAQRSYGAWQTDAGRAAGCLNVMLEAEQATRGMRRAFLRYEDLLADWHRQVQRMGQVLELPELAAVDRVAEVDQLIDPGLHRNRARWGELEVPEHLRSLADHAWELAERLADEPSSVAVQHGLDGARDAYRALYAEAEGIAQSSIVAARPRTRSLRARLTALLPAAARRRLGSAARRFGRTR